MENWKGCGRNESWSNLIKESRYLLRGRVKPSKIIGQYILCASEISSRVSPEYKSKEFLLRQLSRCG